MINEEFPDATGNECITMFTEALFIKKHIKVIIDHFGSGFIIKKK